MQLKSLLEPFGITRYYTDGWGAYERHIDAEKHRVGKDNTQKIAHSIDFSGGACHCSSKSPGGEDLEIEEPISCGDFASFHLHPTLPGMLGTTLVGHQVIQMC